MFCLVSFYALAAAAVKRLAALRIATAIAQDGNVQQPIAVFIRKLLRSNA
jgi:hypothetical protein